MLITGWQKGLALPACFPRSVCTANSTTKLEVLRQHEPLHLATRQEKLCCKASCASVLMLLPFACAAIASFSCN